LKVSNGHVLAGNSFAAAPSAAIYLALSFAVCFEIGVMDRPMQIQSLRRLCGAAVGIMIVILTAA
jgi:hypothetical protein